MTEAAGAPSGRRHARGRSAIALLALVASLALLFGPGLAGHMRLAADPWRFNDDARQQIGPLLLLTDPHRFGGDYDADSHNADSFIADSFIAGYYLANLPRGYRALYGLGARVVDPRTVSKVLPYAELLVVVTALVAATWSLAGPAAAWGTGALCLSTELYLERMTGGLPRSFAFPLVALALLALVRGAPRSVCGLAVLGAAFYYPAAILIGGTAAVYLLLLPAAWRGAACAWPLRQRLVWLVATAAALALLGLPALLAGHAHGARLDRDDAVAFPEAGRGGRYADVDLPLDDRLIDQAVESLLRPLVSFGPPWHGGLRVEVRHALADGRLRLVVAALLLTGCAWLCAARRGGRRLLALPVAACALYGLALALWPSLFVPSRYLSYGLGVVMPVLVPAALASLVGRWRVTRPVAGGLVVAAVAALVVTLGGRGPGDAGLMAPVPKTWRPLYGFIAGLPSDARIAGWPDGAIDNVPYLSGRDILVGFESHQAFHRGYLEEMRRRMAALIEAYFAADIGPLHRLRREFGVTHLLIDPAHYRGEPPHYFEPFDAMIAVAARQAPSQPEPLRQVAHAAVFTAGPLVLLDLDRLAAPAPAIPQPARR